MRPGSQEQLFKVTDGEVEVGETPTFSPNLFLQNPKKKKKKLKKSVKLIGSLQNFVFKKNKVSNLKSNTQVFNFSPDLRSEENMLTYFNYRHSSVIIHYLSKNQ